MSETLWNFHSHIHHEATDENNSFPIKFCNNIVSAEKGAKEFMAKHKTFGLHKCIFKDGCNLENCMLRTGDVYMKDDR